MASEPETSTGRLTAIGLISATVAGGWALVAVAYSASLAWTALLASTICDPHAGDSVFGDLELNWFPLGTRCRFQQASGDLVFQEPGLSTLALQIAVIAVPLILWLASKRLPHRLESTLVRAVMLGTATLVLLVSAAGWSFVASLGDTGRLAQIVVVTQLAASISTGVGFRRTYKTFRRLQRASRAV